MPRSFVIAYTIAALALIAGILIPAVSQAEVTLHTVSYHVGVSGMNNFNPGIAYQHKDVRVGVLYNSFKLPTAYGAYIIPVHERVRFGVGAVTGYEWRDGGIYGKATGVLPLVAAEIDITDNVSVLWFGRALNLEVKF